MLTLLLSLVMNAQAAPCDLTTILRSAKPDQKCVSAYLSKIKNEEDRSEMKFRLKEWKPIKDLQVAVDDGVIEAQDGEGLILRAVILKYRKPMLIWMDGRILADSSDNPSFARRLQNALKARQRTSAALDLVLPSAYAQSPETQTTLLMAFALDRPEAFGGAEKAIARDDFGQFLPNRSPLSKNWLWSEKMTCTSENTVAGGEFTFDIFNNDAAYTKLDISPQSPTEFLIQGLKPNTTHRIRINSEDQVEGKTSLRRLSPRTAGTDMMIETCEDKTCAKISKSEKIEGWSLVQRKSPEEKGEESPLINAMNQTFRTRLGERLFALSVLGECCRTPLCRTELKNRWNIQLQPAGSSPTTSR